MDATVLVRLWADENQGHENPADGDEHRDKVRIDLKATQLKFSDFYIK